MSFRTDPLSIFAASTMNPEDNGNSAVASEENSNPSSGKIGPEAPIGQAGSSTFANNLCVIATCGIVAQEQMSVSAGSDLLDTSAQLGAVLCQVLQSITLFNASSPPVTSPFHSTRPPPMTVRAYVERVVKYSKCSAEALAVSFLLMCQYSVFSGHCINELNVHRLVVTSVLLGAKLRDDEYFSNIYYSRIGGVNAQEMNDLELTMLSTLGWDLWTSEVTFDRLMAMFELARATPLLPEEVTPPHVWQAWWEHMASEATSRRFAVNKTLTDAFSQVLHEQNSASLRGLPGKPESLSVQGLSPAKQRRASRGSLSSSSRVVGFASQNSVGSMADQFPSDPPTSTPTGMPPCSADGGGNMFDARTPSNSLTSPSSQLGWSPGRILTKQRFPRQSSNPRFVDPSSKASPTSQCEQYFPPQQQYSPHEQGFPLSQLSNGCFVQPSPHSQSGKKRSKPEHFVDFR